MASAARLPSLLFALLMAFLVITFFGPADAAFFPKSSSVKILNSENFNKFARDSKFSTIVLYYANWCGHCQKLAPEFSVASQKLKGVSVLGAVDCDVEKSLCRDARIEGFPTVIGYFVDEKLKLNVIPYNGPRTTAGLITFAKQNTPVVVTRLLAVADLQKNLKINSNISKLVLRKNSFDKSVHPKLRHMALALHKKVKFFEVLDPNVEKTAVELYFPNSPEPVKFESAKGEDNYLQLKAFILSTLKKVSEKGEKSDL